MPDVPVYSLAENRFVRHDTLESDNSGLDAITAFPTGGQAGATPLTGAINRITVCATIGDSVLLPVAVAGGDVTVINAGATSCNVFPSTGDNVNALGANAAYALAAGKTAEFYAAGPLHWGAIVSA